MEITLITGNQGKLAEFQELLPGYTLLAAKAELQEIQALDITKVAEYKAQQAFKQLDRPVLVDDSCIIVDEWNGLPGALTSWFIKAVGNEGILRMASGLQGRRARIQTALGYADEAGVRVFLGEVQGELCTEERGSNGFGFDPIFVPDGYQKTLAEMSSAEKNSLSMRRLAVENFLSQGIVP